MTLFRDKYELWKYTVQIWQFSATQILREIKVVYNVKNCLFLQAVMLDFCKI